MKVYAIVDLKAKAVCSTFVSVNDVSAKRSFLQLISSPVPSVFTEYPEDFALYPCCELSFNGNLLVSAHGVDVLNKNGFKVDTFSVSDSLDSGFNYDKRYLKVLRFDKQEAFTDSSSEYTVPPEVMEHSHPENLCADLKSISL